MLSIIQTESYVHALRHLAPFGSMLPVDVSLQCMQPQLMLPLVWSIPPRDARQDSSISAPLTFWGG